MTLESDPKFYDSIGHGYQTHRCPDPRIAAQIHNALGDAKTVCNVGAGTGSYEPVDLEVTAVEPSQLMIDQRRSSFPVIQAQAENLPFADKSFDAAMAVLTVHHWSDPRQGLAEIRRISRRQIVLAYDPKLVNSFWLARDYLPDITRIEASRAIPLDDIVTALGAEAVEPVLIPSDCTDGFMAAYWRRPQEYLNPGVRNAISSFSLLPDSTVSQAMEKLSQDIRSGTWDQRYSHLLKKDKLDAGYRLIVSELKD